MGKKVVVSACLMGRNCKYNGGNNYNEKLVEMLKDREVIEVCPEVAAGMPVPRPAVEILNGRVIRADGTFSKTRMDGQGILAEALAKAGVHLIDVEDI